MNKDFLIKLRESAEFRQVMLDAMERRPVIPKWEVGGGDLLVEQIKFQTGAQQGFDILWTLLTGKGVGNGRAD